VTPAEWIEKMRTAFADADAVTRDLLRPLRQRELGHASHVELYDAAFSMVAYLLENPPEVPHG